MQDSQNLDYYAIANNYTHFCFTFRINSQLHLHRGGLETINNKVCNRELLLPAHQSMVTLLLGTAATLPLSLRSNDTISHPFLQSPKGLPGGLITLTLLLSGNGELQLHLHVWAPEIVICVIVIMCVVRADTYRVLF